MSEARIMIVEDERVVAEDIKEGLQNMGYAVTSVARSGEMAIKMAEKDRPDLVLMDIVLKGKMDGFETAKQFRSRFDIPVVYLSAYSDKNIMERAKHTEPFGYIVKPFREKELQINIEIGLYKYKMEKELKNSKDWFYTTLKSIGDAVIAVDMNRNVVFMNPTAQLLTGWNQKDGVGKKLNEVFKIFNGGNNNLIEVYENNSTNDFFSKGKAQTVLIDKYGIKLPVEETYTPITDNYGNTIGHVLVFHDTIDQKRTENELKMALKEWQNIFNAISDCVLILDLDGYILNSNGVYESMTGQKTENIIGQHCYNVMHCSSEFIKNDPIEKIKQNRIREYFELIDIEHRLRFQVTMDPIFSNSGDIIKAILIMRNVRDFLISSDSTHKTPETRNHKNKYFKGSSQTPKKFGTSFY
jgi:PAS domain S-box-containing protein